MKKIIQILAIISLFTVVQSCKKNQTGGKATLKGMVMHHSKAIPNAVVYIKFNTTEFPGDGPSFYNTSVTADENGNYSIDFYKGSYYIYAVGLDMDLPYPYKVKGGLSISIRNKEHLTKDIAVTEE